MRTLGPNRRRARVRAVELRHAVYGDARLRPPAGAGAEPFGALHAVGTNRHYWHDEILGRHFIQSGEAAGLSKRLVTLCIEKVTDTADMALAKIARDLPKGFPEAIHVSVGAAVTKRLAALGTG